MASVYKRGHIWYASFKNADGLWDTQAACTDKTASQQIANRLETDAMLRREGLIDTREDELAQAKRLPIETHLIDFEKGIASRRGNTAYAAQTRQRVERMAALAAIKTIAELIPDRVNAAIGKLRDDEYSVSSIAHHVRAVKMFNRWLLLNKRTRDDALISVKVGATIERSDRKMIRMEISQDHFNTLIEYTRNAPTAYDMPGGERAMLYTLAAATGFRQRELRSLTPASFNLDDATVTVTAAYSKRKRDDTQPFNPELCETLSAWLANKPKGKPIFNLPVRWELSEMLRDDAVAAGIPTGNLSGEVLTFHSLRVSYISWLVRSGASVKTCQSLARHSTPMLTVGTYARMSHADQEHALHALPVPGSPKSEKQPMLKTGTYDTVENVQKTGGFSRRKLSLTGTHDTGDMAVAVCEENPHQQQESIDSIDCPGRDSNPHDRKRSQDFKS